MGAVQKQVLLTLVADRRHPCQKRRFFAVRAMRVDTRILAGALIHAPAKELRAFEGAVQIH
jgi:hypothetical protein